MSIYYSFNLPVSAIVLFCVALAGLLYILVVYLWRLRVVRKRRRVCDRPSEDICLGLPTASVVVYAAGEGETLSENLQKMLEQKFDGHYEVIVVNDGANPDTEMAVTRLQNEYSNLYITFAPAGARNLSRKKLALTLGIKAAKGEVVVLTDACTRVGSDHWLQDMVSPFADDNIQVVIGYNTPIRGEGKTKASRAAVYDAMEDAVTWLGAALNASPYRATLTNMAYRRDLFFSYKGFSKSLNLVGGADDIFIYEIADGDNTYVQLSTASLGTEGYGQNMGRRLLSDRVGHHFTGRKLPKLCRRLMVIGEWMMWIVAACALAGMRLCGLGNVVGWVAAALIIVTMFVCVAMAWRKTLLSLGGPRMSWRLLLLVPTRPLRNIIVGLRSRFGSTAKYSWE